MIILAHTNFSKYSYMYTRICGREMLFNLFACGKLNLIVVVFVEINKRLFLEYRYAYLFVGLYCLTYTIFQKHSFTHTYIHTNYIHCGLLLQLLLTTASWLLRSLFVRMYTYTYVLCLYTIYVWALKLFSSH